MVSKRHILFAVVLGLSGAVLGSVRNLEQTNTPPGLAYPAIDPAAISSSKQVKPKAIQAYLQNGGFETPGVGGNPAEWAIFREAFLDNDPALARSGARSVRSSYLLGWYQALLAPVSPYQSFSVAGFANREFAEERAGTRALFFDGVGNFLSGRELSASPTDGAPGNYGAFWTTHEVPAQTAWLQLYLRGISPQSWLRFDDLILLTEQIRMEPGNTGEAWHLHDGATTIGEVLELPPGAEATQRVVVGLENHGYFIWGHYTATETASLRVTEEWVPRGFGDIATSTSVVHNLIPGTSTFVVDPGRPTGTASGQGRVRFSNEGSTPITLNLLRRGFGKVEPAAITAGPGSPDSPLKLTAAWPEHLTSATIELRDDSDVLITNLSPTYHGTSIRAEWSPDTETSGACTARFILEAGDGQIAVVDRPFMVLREDAASPIVSPWQSSQFLRGAWLFIQRFNNAEIEQAIALAKQDGFNTLVVVSRHDQLAALRAAAELHEVPFIIFTVEAMALFHQYTERTWFSKADYLAQLKTLYAPLINSPYFLGTYIADEPTRPEAFDVLGRANIALAQDAELGLPFSVLLENTSLAQVAAVQQPVVTLDLYPFRSQYERASTDALLDRLPLVIAMANTARSEGRDLWILPQGFEEPGLDQFYPVPPVMHWAQLGTAVMCGARGIIPFTYTASGPADGLRGPGLIAVPKLEPYVRFNAVVNRIEDVLLDMEIPQLEPGATRPFAVSSAISGGQRYVFVLNADDTTTRTMEVQLSAGLGSEVIDLVSEQPLPVTGGETVQVALGAGEWAMFSVGTATITGLNALPATPPSLSTLALPLTHSLTVTRSGGGPQPVFGLEFSPDANALAISAGYHSYEPTPPLAYTLNANGTVTRETGPVRFPAERMAITADGLYAVLSPNLGFRRHVPGAFGGAVVDAFRGRSGGAYDILQNGNNYWLSQMWMGMRQLELNGANYSTVSAATGVRGQYLDLFGPFDDGSISVVVSDFGLSNIKPGQTSEGSHQFAQMDRLDGNGSMNPNRLVAVPRHQRGVGLFQLSHTGVPQVAGEIATDAVDATAVAWITNTVLAVADGERNTKFYRVNANLSTVPIGTWRPPVSGNFYIRALAARGGRLAVGCFNGRVFVADVSQFDAPATAMDWELFE